MIEAEQKLFRLYFLSSVLFLVSIVTFAVPWGHWSHTLDRCVGETCDCVLYGTSYSDAFNGGSTEYCQFITFSQIPPLIISIILTFYHGVRGYIKPRRAARKTQWRGNPLLPGSRGKKKLVDANLPEPEPPSLGGAISLVIMATVIFLLLLVVLGFFNDGQARSCNEYRKTLVRNLHASGRFAYILNNRLLCTSIFDFMDYLQPDRRFPEEPLKYMRRDRINTGMSLFMSNVSLITNTIIWIIILVVNCKLLMTRIRKSRE